jgi:hypothetical protein
VAKEKPQALPDAGVTEDEALRCVVCKHRISERAYRIEMAGAYEHTFVNPHGIAFHIGCFAAAPGCVHLGGTEEAFSWFPGWAWQVAACGRCRAHVGWIYRAIGGLAGQQFHGLILDKLE